MAKRIRAREISSFELVTAHLKQIERVNPAVNAVVDLLANSALKSARAADATLDAGGECGPLHGVPFSIKDSIEVAGTKCSAGTLGRKNAPPSGRDATLVGRLRAAGAIPIAKTNLPDLLFSFETDNLIYGRTNNPYDTSRTPGGSSGGEAALIAACGSPLGLGSDAFGSVRVPAAFCGTASIKPTSGRLPRTGHVPPAGGWAEALWQIGPMARRIEDLILAMRLLAHPDGEDFTSPPAPLLEPGSVRDKRVAFFVDNGFARCAPAIQNAVRRCATFFAREGFEVEERTPPGLGQVFDLEMALFGADGAEGIDEYLREAGSNKVHVLHRNFVDYMRPYRARASELAHRWAQWDDYRANLARFFAAYDVILCPVYTNVALPHRGSLDEENFRGFSYTMAWNLAGAPAATVRCADFEGLPVNLQVVAKPWQDLLVLEMSRLIEAEFGGWKPAGMLADSASELEQAEAK